MIKTLLLTTWLALLVTGCASNRLEACPSKDWNVIGYEDGKRGNGPYSARSLRKSCHNIATPFDEQAYNSGLQKGLLEFCTPANGYALGRTGATDHTRCSDNHDGDFSGAYTLGLEHHKIDREADKLRDELQAAQRERRRTQDRLDALRTGGSSGGYGIERTSKTLMDNLSYYDERIAHLKSEIRKISDKIVEPPYFTGD